MKKVIFLCLLSLSLCLSQPAENKSAVPNPPITGESKLNATTVLPPKVETNKANVSTATAANATAVTQTPSNETSKVTEDNNTQHKEEDKTTTLIPKEGAATKANETRTTEATPQPSTEASKPTETKAKDVPKPDTKDFTPKTNDTVVTTEAPKSDKDAHIVQARGFDGPSFFGGIVLTLGLLAIGFMGYKYYKNQTERNYHTL